MEDEWKMSMCIAETTIGIGIGIDVEMDSMLPEQHPQVFIYAGKIGPSSNRDG